MPLRMVREGIVDSERVNRLSFPAEVFYRRLMSVVDDYGRYDAREAILRAKLYSLKLDRVSESDIGKWMLETAEAGLVRLYAVEGKRYLVIDRFGQLIRTRSKWPPPPGDPPDPPERAYQPPRPRSARSLRASRAQRARPGGGAAPTGLATPSPGRPAGKAGGSQAEPPAVSQDAAYAIIDAERRKQAEHRQRNGVAAK